MEIVGRDDQILPIFRNGHVIFTLQPTGTVVGFFENAQFTTKEILFDLVFFCFTIILINNGKEDY